MAASINIPTCCEYLRQQCMLLRLVPSKHLSGIISDMHACATTFRGSRRSLDGYLRVIVRKWTRRRTLPLWVRILIRLVLARIVKAFLVYMHGPE